MNENYIKSDTILNDYSNGLYGFSIKRPEKWKVNDNNLTDKTCVKMYNTRNELHNESLTIAYEESKWSDVSMREFCQTAIHKMNNIRSHFELIEDKVIHLHCGDCAYFSFEYESDWGKRYSVNTYVPYKKSIFSLLMEAPENQKINVQPVFMKMIQSFKIIPSLNNVLLF